MVRFRGGSAWVVLLVRERDWHEGIFHHGYTRETIAAHALDSMAQIQRNRAVIGEGAKRNNKTSSLNNMKGHPGRPFNTILA